MRGIYVPSIGKAFRPHVHEWRIEYNGGTAAKTDCAGIVALVDKIAPVEDPVTCPGCLKVAQDERAS